MLVIGLTGGIASGKSVAANRLATHNIPIIDTDHIARQLTAPNQPAFTKIVHRFGTAMIQANGDLNRRKLRRLIFEKPMHKTWLEQLLHPPIRETVKQRVHALSQQSKPPPYCVVVIPLLAETQAYSWLDHILVIDTDEITQQTRLQTRDDLSKDQCQTTLANQASRRQRLAIANSVITNNTTLAAFLSEIDQQHQYYLTLSQSH